MRVLDEPLRGQIPPPWFPALSGLERMRAWSNRILPAPPAARLLGVRLAHVGPGMVACVMPAGEIMLAPNGQIETWPLLSNALNMALATAVGPGQYAKPLTMFVNYFRPARPGAGNLLAKARVINSSSLFAYAEVLVEDAEGRQIAHGGAAAAIVLSDPAPPPPPRSLEPVDEPAWATPDPWQRPAGAMVPLSLWETTDGINIITDVASGTLRSPFVALLDCKLEAVSRGRITAVIPASEWFCDDSHRVSISILTAFTNLAGWCCGLTTHRAGDTLAGLDTFIRFFRHVRADGRPIRAEAHHEVSSDDALIFSVTVTDADGRVALISSTAAAPIDNARRKRPRRRPTERMLCTILFTDIVDSTARAESLGDAAWSALLEQHQDVARREIGLCDGRQVKNTGDGLLVRFFSPARAIDCATRLRRSLADLGIQIRAGLHAGECEVTDDDIVGVAVHLAARIQEAAAPGEVLVSSTVRDLTIGGGYQFENHGEHRLKGVEEPWRLWSVR
jgi:class 3 adenylate cyclase